MSTDLPENAIDLGIADQVDMPHVSADRDGVNWQIQNLGTPHRIVAIPVPAPEPPSLAEKIMRRLWEIACETEPDERPWEEIPERHEAVAACQRVVDDLGLVCRDEVPTVTQVMEAAGWTMEPPGYWRLTGLVQATHWSHDYATKALTAIGAARADQEPT